jgi:ribonucleoside-diphosphate reductase alpha chain
MSEYKFIKDYAQWLEEESRYETWEEAVDRVMAMHETKYKEELSNPKLRQYFEYARTEYKEKNVLASQRTLQFGGQPTLKKQERVYNCLTSYCDRVRFFQEAMHWLLCGGGVGFSVQKKHVEKLPKLHPRDKGVKTFVINDSIEGWSDAFGVLLSSYLAEDATFPEYQGYRVDFDYSNIRPEGSLISGGYKAPGPDGLRASVIKVQEILDKVSVEQRKLKPIECYDFVMHMSDAVLSGGVRRSATICVFGKDDPEMMSAKTGDWFIKNPQRGRSNNSVLLVRDEAVKEEFLKIFESVKQFGEPGIVWAETEDVLYNPCVEIGFIPISPSGNSSWQGCNLTECNGGHMSDRESVFRIVKAATILGTLQAGYTDFNYSTQDTIDTFKKEALLGVSITGWMENPKVLFDPELLKEAAEYAKEVNKEVAELIGINPAARVCCTKPSGNASVLLGTSSGIHPHHAKRYFRHIQGNKEEDIVKAFAEANPKAVEESVWSANGKDLVLSFPITAPRGSILRESVSGLELLEYVKLVQNSWVEYGTNVELCNHPKLRHNVSNTITVDDWDATAEYVYENRHHFAGISFLPPSGDKDYAQAPFTEVKTPEKILEEYGTASMLASGLIVDGLHAFNNNLWLACDSVLDRGIDLSNKGSDNLLQRDWVRRVKKFSRRYFKNDLILTTYCLKDIHLLHKWETVTRSFKPIDWLTADIKPKYTDVNTLGAQSCHGGVCDINI